VQAQGASISRQTVYDALDKALVSYLDGEVKDGTITQQQGDVAKARLSTYINRVLDSVSAASGAPTTTVPAATSTTTPGG